MALRFLGRVRSWLGLDPIVSGTIVATNHYPPRPPSSNIATVGTGKDERMVPVSVSPGSGSESWSVTVEGVDKRGNKVKEEIYVTWSVWSTIKVGDEWPRT